MYSKYDFRFLVLNSASDEELESSLILEPWTEIIKLWKKYPEHEKIIKSAIEYNISHERYNPFLLSDIFDYPELHKTCLEAFLEVWKKYPVRMDENSITIGKIPENVALSPEQKLHLLKHISFGKITLRMDSVENEYGIWLTPGVHETYRLISYFSK